MTEVNNLGQCGRIVDETNEIVCGNPAVAEVLVRTKFTLGVMRLCQKDFDQHRAFYEELNRRTGRRRRWRNQRREGFDTSTPAALRPNSTPGRDSDQPNADADEVYQPAA